MAWKESPAIPLPDGAGAGPPGGEPPPGGRGAGALVVIYGRDLGKRYRLRAGVEVALGSDDTCDLRFNDPSVRPRHAVIVWREDQPLVRDLDSGVHVNEEGVDERALVHADQVRLGKVVLQFIPDDESAYHDLIFRLTIIDGLTGAYNRRYLVQELDRILARTARYRRAMTVIVVELRGDATDPGLLVRAAGALQRSLGREEFLARYAGRTFAVVLPETDDQEAPARVEALRQSLPTARESETSYSIGCFSVGRDGVRRQPGDVVQGAVDDAARGERAR